MFFDTNKIATVFGRDNIFAYINDEVKKGNLVKIKNRSIIASERKATTANGYSKNTSKDSISDTPENVKQKQFEIIEKVNPAPNSYLTWIRKFEDVKTLSETLEDSEWSDYDEFNPDLTRGMLEEAIEKGEITVYSSYQIKQGTFVSPSYMEAESYLTLIPRISLHTKIILTFIFNNITR